MNYELLDFGNDRKLERLGDWILDRPAPGAGGTRSHPQLWSSATARYQGDRTTEGAWTPAANLWHDETLELPITLSPGAQFTLALSPLPSGQIGIFPEQFENWQWIAAQAARTSAMRVLNLFAYTGGSTLAAAVSGAHVTHVDAAKSMVSRAKENAHRSGLGDAPIRYVIEDALKFCQREVKRSNQYDAVILDPPTYGHGPSGEKWSIKRDLLPLLKLCQQLTTGSLQFVLLSCHTPEVSGADLSDWLSETVCADTRQRPQSGRLDLQTADGPALASGDFARWAR